MNHALTFGRRPATALPDARTTKALAAAMDELRAITARLRDNTQPLPSLRELRRACVLRAVVREHGLGV